LIESVAGFAPGWHLGSRLAITAHVDALQWTARGNCK
jgi:hypothetical protein